MTPPDPAPRELTVALLGGGTVGSQVARLLHESADDLAARAGAPLRLVGVGVRDAQRPRTGMPDALLTDDLTTLATSGADITANTRMAPPMTNEARMARRYMASRNDPGRSIESTGGLRASRCNEAVSRTSGRRFSARRARSKARCCSTRPIRA